MPDPIAIIVTAVRTFVQSRAVSFYRLASETGLSDRAFTRFLRDDHDPKQSTLRAIWAVMPNELKADVMAELSFGQSDTENREREVGVGVPDGSRTIALSD